ncbi:MAG: hypothetical protein H7227_07845 [Actinobacteria bacterium]|nr:hypothetical protein [Actinomycetota bacterium]
MDTGSNPHNFMLAGGNIGVLIVSQSSDPHELASTMAHSLHALNRSVAVASPPTRIENWGDLREHEWPIWFEGSQELLAKLHESCESVFVVGISMGATLALRIAELYSNDVDGLVIIEPTFPNIRRSQRTLWAPIRSELGQIVQPIIQMSFSNGRNESATNAAVIADNISSPFIREILLEQTSSDSDLIITETAAFIEEVTGGLWLSDVAEIVDIADIADAELINAEFQSIVEGLSLDESTPTTYLDQLEYLDHFADIEHFNAPDPKLAPIADPRKRRAFIAMILGPIYTLVAAITYFDPLGIEPWPGILAFIGGLVYFFYALRDTPVEDDGVIL